MSKIEKILVCTDFSEGSAAAARYGLLLAERCQAKLDVLHVCWEPPEYLGIEVVMMEMPTDVNQSAHSYIREKAEKQMDGFLTGLKAKQQIHQTLYSSGNAVSRILETVIQGQYDLLVMGTHGRGGIDKLLLGSVAEKVLRKAPCPVLTVRAPD